MTYWVAYFLHVLFILLLGMSAGKYDRGRTTTFDERVSAYIMIVLAVLFGLLMHK
jgi:hypothetical protein